ncbi:MAG: thiamine-phosphate kinase [Pelagibacteraceae bacterium TMED267]|nr:MAG: thiamine-phosphate kinase [Pelagibacteraceae bacterium TMED267]|tara:strand:+ start:354 stop:1313 length:960 start_codon:yes stop_codon:yes gene_type:complete
MDEFHIIKRYFSNLAKKNKYALNLNDDVFYDKKKGIVISIDTYHERNHFLNFKNPDLVIKKIIRSSISDLICKGVQPKYYFISGSGNKKAFSKKNLIKISSSLKLEQKKYGIYLCGGDTTFSNTVSFSITSLGYSKNIIYRNKAKLNDDIYVTGNLGDSFIGLQILKNKIKCKKKISDYFINKYFLPDVQIKLVNKLSNFANSSIDISDGLFSDLEKMLNKQDYSFLINLDKIPVSKYLLDLIKDREYKKKQLISNGDDYQVLFTANVNKSRIIHKTSKILGIKITKIGKIISSKNKSTLVDQKGRKILLKYKGYTHQF